MKNIKKLMITLMIILLIICMIIGVLIYLNKINTEKQISEKIEKGEGDPLEIEYVSQQLNDPTKFFSVENYIKNNIDENFVAKDMNILDEERITSYAVKGNIEESGEDIYLIFRVDNDNMTYSIERVDNVKELKEINLEDDNVTEIRDEGNNTFEYTTVNSEEMCRRYLEDFTQKELNQPQEAYNLIDEEYKSIRFPTFEDYQEYIEEYQDIFSNAVLAKYNSEIKDGYTEYTLVDNYDTSYTVKAKGVWDYTIRLDNYTIKIDTYEENYNKLSEEQKIQSNVYIFLQMINTRDYKHAYELLDETFRNNNFDTLDTFKEYVKNNFFNYNLNTTTDVKINKEGNTYIYETIIRSGSGRAAEDKKLTVIMQLEEGTDFRMSFSIE